MKNLLSVCVIVATIIAITSCNEQKIDPIRDGKSINDAYSSGFPIDRFTELGQKSDYKGQFLLFDRYRRFLTRNLVQNKENLTDHQQIHFLIGSGFANGVESGDGRLLSGEFSGQLIAVIKDSLIQDTIFIDGGRRAESINVTQKVDLGEASPFRFTIDKNTKIDSIIIMTKEWNNIVTNPITINDETKSFSAYLQNYKTFLKDGDVIDIIRGKIFDKDGKEVLLTDRAKPKNLKKRR